jgi:EpsI family protein
MTTRRRLVAVVVALALPTLFLWRWLLVSASPPPDGWALVLPEKLGPWQVTSEAQLPANVFTLLEPDAYVLRRYEAPGRPSIDTYVGVYGGRVEYGKGAHDPEICYPAHGWEIVGSRTLEVPLGSRETLWASLLDAHAGAARQTVVYWFQPAGRWPREAFLEELLRLEDALAGRPQYAFVRLAAASDGETVVRELAEFVSHLARPIRSNLDGPPSPRSTVPGFSSTHDGCPHEACAALARSVGGSSTTRTPQAPRPTRDRGPSPRRPASPPPELDRAEPPRTGWR